MSPRVRHPARAGAAAALALCLCVAFGPVASAKRRARHGLKVTSINVKDSAGVPANSILEVSFTTLVNPATVTPASLQVRGLNTTSTGYTKQVFGSIQAVANVVRFYPRLPGHRRKPDGTFFPEGSPEDDAQALAGLQPSTNYQIRVVGGSGGSPVRASNGARLPADVTARFATALAFPAARLWSTSDYSDAPPPAFSFSNPPDRVPAAGDQYALRGGASDVPASVGVSLFCTKVPLAPGTLRIPGNVDLTMTSRGGDASLRRPIAGSVFVEQNFETTRVEFVPRVPLADRATYRLRLTKGVRDLTETHDFAQNAPRERLRAVYDFLAAGRALNPGAPAAQLPDPPADLIADWPSLTAQGGAALRGILKTNLLALGDTSPDEIDPRTMVVFTTRDEPVSPGFINVEFLKSEKLTDETLSTGTVDEDVAGAAAAVFTAAAGSGADGDFAPTKNTNLSADAFPNGEMNFRRIKIPAGVTVTVTGARPATIKAMTLQLDGTLALDGAAGQSASTAASQLPITSQANQLGGAGGPGGGRGGNSSADLSPGTGGTGSAGVDLFQVTASPQDGGRPGAGGQMGPIGGTYALGGGGGGGGGVRTAGLAGQASTSTTVSWNAAGGAGGAAAIGNDDLSPLVGGAGGGAGGNGSWNGGQWATTGGAGGGGGGALILQTAGTFTVGTSGSIRARGGAGGNGPNSGNSFPSGPGGGGGGGSVLLRTSKIFNFANPAAAFDVSGGVGGTQVGAGVAPAGGNGGAGLVRTENPSGGVSIPGAASGVFNPVGGGVPSVVYTKLIDLGIQGARILAFTASDVVTVTQDDAVLVEAQMTREDPARLDKPDLSSITSSQDSSNPAVASQWVPVKLHDETRLPGGAFGTVAGLPAQHPTEYASFPVDALNGRGYRFIRFRVRFQLGPTQTPSSAVPYVERITTRYQFNF